MKLQYERSFLEVTKDKKRPQTLKKAAEAAVGFEKTIYPSTSFRTVCPQPPPLAGQSFTHPPHCILQKHHQEAAASPPPRQASTVAKAMADTVKIQRRGFL